MTSVLIFSIIGKDMTKEQRDEYIKEILGMFQVNEEDIPTPTNPMFGKWTWRVLNKVSYDDFVWVIPNVKSYLSWLYESKYIQSAEWSFDDGVYNRIAHLGEGVGVDNTYISKKPLTWTENVRRDVKGRVLPVQEDWLNQIKN